MRRTEKEQEAKIKMDEEAEMLCVTSWVPFWFPSLITGQVISLA